MCSLDFAPIEVPVEEPSCAADDLLGSVGPAVHPTAASGSGSAELTATDGVMELLGIVLGSTAKANGGSFTYKLCSEIPHISQRRGFGSKWSCGYRNVQMLSSALIKIPQYKEVLFGGSGCIPDIPGLQRWIEEAWEEGFDPPGREQLHGRLVGTSQWIGATGMTSLALFCFICFFVLRLFSFLFDCIMPVAVECCALFRFFGVRAEVVDVVSRVPSGRTKGRKRGRDDPGDGIEGVRSPTATGAALFDWFKNTYCGRVQHEWTGWLQTASDACDPSSSSGSVSIVEPTTVRAAAPVVDMTGDSDDDAVSGSGSGYGQAVSGSGSGYGQAPVSGGNEVLNVKQSPESFLPPVYLQRQGHSTTVVGYQASSGASGEIGSLLIMNPSSDGDALLRSLREAAGVGGPPSDAFSAFRSAGWAKSIRCGLDSFWQDSYQVVYIAPGLLTAAERSASKCISSKRIEI